MTITLATLAQATEQEVFDQVATHLRKQGRPATTDTGKCRYQTPEGLKCAAGCLITEVEYDAAFERRSWGSLVGSGFVPNAHAALITSLQFVHDSWVTEVTDGWSAPLEKGLASIAEEYNLVYTQPS